MGSREHWGQWLRALPTVASRSPSGWSRPSHRWRHDDRDGWPEAAGSRLPGRLTCYVVMLLPVAGFFHNGYQIAAGRYTYLPGVVWAVLGVDGFVAV